MRPCHFFQRLAGVRRNVHLVLSLFRQLRHIIIGVKALQVVTHRCLERLLGPS